MKNIDLKQFLEKNKIRKIISFSGGYRDINDNKERARKAIEESMIVYQNFPVAILTGGTEWNLPNDAIEIAKDYGLKVIGVMPKTGEKYKIKNLDKEIVIPPIYGKSEWCDESQVFSKMSDGITLIGGGPGTGVEIFQAMKISLDKIYDEETPIFLAPISGFGGIEDLIYKSPFVNQDFMPEKPFNNGTEAAKYLVEKLGLIKNQF